MTAHKHAEMIKAKADNMGLVVLRKHYDGGWVEVADQSEIRIKQNGNYFLCLPQHKESCLHWLNGGEVEFNSEFVDDWTEYEPFKEWGVGSVFMQDDYKTRIKPRKEKCWVAVDEKGKAVPTLIKDEDSLENAKQLMDGCSFHEIEVEV